MIYLSGVTSKRIEDSLIEAGIGLMLQPGNGYVKISSRYPCHAADNACYANKWDEDKWIHWLDTVPREQCLFAVSPDVYPDAEKSLERGLEFAPIIRDMGFPVAIVAQDGAEDLDWPWDEFDCLFIGGERQEDPRLEWKTSSKAENLAAEARRNGKWVHMGRVNSMRRLRRAKEMGCNSSDGTFIKYRKRKRAGEGDDNRHERGEMELFEWQQTVNSQQSLFTFETPSHPNHRIALR